MSEDRLVIDGKNYISSVRAAQLFGYTKDYVGQLARAGKIQSQLIGRSWYVDEDSIRNHKLTVHYTLTKPKKTRRNETNIPNKTSEKSIKNIDISPSRDISTTYDGFSYIHESKNAKDESFDLFPRPVKKSAHAELARSEILYESDPPLAYTVEAYPRSMDGLIPIQNRLLQGAKGASSILERTAGVSGRNRVVQTVRPVGGSVSMDGIILPDSKPLPHEMEGGVFTHRKTGSLATVDESYEEEDFADVPNRPSRAIALVGALLLFTILVVVYIIV